MSGFTDQVKDDELRVRAGQAFQVGSSRTGGNVNPTQVAFFNPAASGIVALFVGWRALGNFGAVSVNTLRPVNADPGLTADLTPQNCKLGGPAGQVKHESADAALIAGLGTINVGLMAIDFQQQDDTPGVIMCPAGFGLVISFGVTNVLVGWRCRWYELPA